MWNYLFITLAQCNVNSSGKIVDDIDGVSDFVIQRNIQKRDDYQLIRNIEIHYLNYNNRWLKSITKPSSVLPHNKISKSVPSTHELRKSSIEKIFSTVSEKSLLWSSSKDSARMFSCWFTEALHSKLNGNHNNQNVQCILEHICHEIRVRRREPFKQTFKTFIFAIYVFWIRKNDSRTICIHFDFVWVSNIPHKYLNAQKNGNLTRHIVNFTI